MTDHEHGAVVESRIAHIADMMRDLTFRTGKTVRALAAEWGLSESSVHKYASEASRQVLAEVHDKDYVSVTVGIALRTVIEGALKDIEEPPMVDGQGAVYPESPNKSRAMVIAAADKWAELTGAKAAAKVTLDGRVGVSLGDIDEIRKTASANEALVDGGSDDEGGAKQG